MLRKKNEVESYSRYLGLIGSLSRLFSESDIPYLHYRILEKIFCRSFGAEDLSRSDVSVDSKLNEYGIGIKTFRAENNATF